MILADKIIALRKKNGWSQEELAEMLDVSRQSISKWEGAQAIPDMNRVLKLSEVFGVSTDYLLKDDMEAVEVIETPEGIAGIRSVSMEEADDFLHNRDFAARKISVGVAMCIFSPVLLLVLSAAMKAGTIALPETTVTGIGLVVLLLLVAGAVALFLFTGIRSNKYEYLEKEPIDTAYGVSGMVTERRERYRETYTKYHISGIVLCVLSAIPLFVSMIFFNESGAATLYAVALLLTLVAVGVFFIIRVNVIWGGYQMLLEEGDYTRENKETSRKAAPFVALYWIAVVTVYLAYSFFTGQWDRSWIIWPVAGVACGMIYIVTGLLRKKG